MVSSMARVRDKRVRGDGSLGERVRRRRKSLSLTAKDLAESAGVSPSYISQLEHGKQDRPSLEVLGALAAALGISTSELLGEALTVIPPPDTPPALASLAEELGLDATTTSMLASINLAGNRPATREGWLLIWLAIKHTCAGSAAASLANTAGA